MADGRYYITTAIDYVNSRPHIGTAFEKIAADVLARYHRFKGDDTFFAMGNDEHSLNVEKEARKQGLEPLAYCDEMEGQFTEIWQSLSLSYDRFIRTTDPDHAKAVGELFRRIEARGDIYKDVYSGLYCVSCENFYQEKDLADGLCPVHKTKPEQIEEENYFFKLSAYADKLLAHIEADENFIRPEIRKNEIVNVIKSGLIDVSVSRSTRGWGIPLPSDDSHVVYVWFDALINYITAAGFPGDEEKFKRYWPADVHVIGKDITRFHCIIWPAMLMSAGIELPRTVYAHGFITVDGQKISKSIGNVIDPRELVEEFGADAVRYYFMREVSFEQDGDFSKRQLLVRYNADLANDLGNLLNRLAGMTKKYIGDVFPTPDPAEDDGILRDLASDIATRYTGHIENYQFNDALRAVWELVRRGNQYVEESTPWTLAKDPDRRARLETVLYNVAESLRITACLTYPVMPAKSAELLTALGISDDPAAMRLDTHTSWRATPEPGQKLAVTQPLFPRFEEEEANA